MEPTECTVAEYLAIRLEEIGVRHIFSVPGDFIVPFLQTIDDLGVISRGDKSNGGTQSLGRG